MIAAHADLGAIAQRLVAQAEALAKARAVMIARRRDARRWRQARLLWPMFGEE